MPALRDFKKLHPHLDTVLTNYESHIIPHALLIQGQSGVGKRTLAQLISMLVLCSSDDNRPCQTCDTCKRVLDGVHSNILSPKVQPGANSIKIDDMRELLDMLSRHGLEEGARVVIIEEAGRLTPQAQNALLKSLEEPFADTYFILTTSAERSLLPTIRSRCSSLNIPAWDRDSMLKVLSQHQVNGKDAEELIALSGGSPGQALSSLQSENYWDTVTLVKGTFLSIAKIEQIPAASNKLKNSRDQAEEILSILEAQVSLQLTPDISAERARGINHMLQAILTARQYRASNVSWQAITDRLLFHSLEDLYQCQWS